VSALGPAQLMAFAGATDLDRAREFYGGVLGLELEQEDSFACQFRCGDTLLRVTRVDEVAPAPYTVLGWRVPDIESAIQELAGRGVQFQRYDGMRQDELGAWSAPGGARVAWFRDPDGNTLSIVELA
jgi:catechol 2,3-dioxygenase-like lactoylglutathione lyase family enzyme